ncbi:MAG: hypothetical protein H0V56_09780 [Chthoniobacterales bacterium]|nr:hypothetical protein [Chthoniobacterales bacterium]
MKRVLLPVAALALLGAGLWFGLTSGAKSPSLAVAALLPKETLAVVHLPDLNTTRAQWQQTDIYRLWSEPAVQDFLARPLSRNPDAWAGAQQLEQFEPLEAKDLFVAVVPVGERNLRLLGGFRFKGTRQDVEKLLGPWRERSWPARPETVQHQQHQIEVRREGGMLLATVYAADWFLAANDVPVLQTLLDRLDDRTPDAAAPLLADQEYVSATGRMPVEYAFFGYARLAGFFERLPAALPPGSTVQEGSLVRRIRSIAAATKFEGGKIRDVMFVTMPKADEMGELTRGSLSLTTANSFLYFAGMLHPTGDVSPQSGPAALTPGLPTALQGMLTRLARGGTTRDEWENTFGAEVGVIGDWQPESRFPSLLATLPVKDFAKANEMLANIAGADEENAWTTSERDGVRYYTQPPANPMVPVAPTVAISNQLLVAGLDAPSVEAAMQRAVGRNPGLAASASFETASRLVPTPRYSFTYVDLALLYTRLDAAVRPMLIMAAAFMPGITERVDLGKLPPADVVVRHLGPTVVSQSYDADGYVLASVGSISIYHAALGIAAATGAGVDFYRRQNQMIAEPDDAAAPAVHDPDAEPTPPTEEPDEEQEP